MSDQYGDPIDEAIEILSEVVRDCGLGDPEVKSVLRRCLYVAHLIGDAEYQELYGLHISGFPGDRVVPVSRRIHGRVHWKSERLVAESSDYIGTKADRELGTPAAPVLESRESIERIESRAKSGLIKPSTEMEQNSTRMQRSRSSPYSGTYTETIAVFPWNICPAANYKYALDRIRHETFEWAMTTVVRLKYQSRITNIWENYRTEVDGKLAEINLTNHLSALDRQIGSDNQQEWRSALYSCRNMLRDVADYLWRDSSRTFRMPDTNGMLVDFPVDKEKYITRLNAYLYFKTRSRTETQLTRTEAELLGSLIGRANSVDNYAHEAVDRGLAESAALHTYMVIADLIRLTDMEPVTDASSI